MKGTCKSSEAPLKEQTMNHGHRKGRRDQSKGIESILNRAIIENYPNIEKEMAIRVQVAFRTLNRGDQKSVSPKHIIVKILNVQNKEGIYKAARQKCHVT
jgi:hypothetical protein